MDGPLVFNIYRLLNPFYTVIKSQLSKVSKFQGQVKTRLVEKLQTCLWSFKARSLNNAMANKLQISKLGILSNCRSPYTPYPS